MNLIHIAMFVGVILALIGCVWCAAGESVGPSSSLPKTNWWPAITLVVGVAIIISAGMSWC